MQPSLPESGSDNAFLEDILRVSATSSKGVIIYYPPGNASDPQTFTYLDLLNLAHGYSQVLQNTPNFQERKPILLHLDDQWDSIVWFWATLLAKAIPVLSSSFSHIDDQRHQHIQGLSKLLQSPICITRERLLPMFDGTPASLRLKTIESLQPDVGRTPCCKSKGLDESTPELELQSACVYDEKDESLAMLMLSSGSTGSPKAVRLTHKQVMTAISGKASLRQLHQDGSFLNWIGLDHVASLVEIHMQALWLGVDQIHVCTADVVSSPPVFLRLLSQHRVCRTFAPNFFLGRLVSASQSQTGFDENTCSWDLSNLQIVASGGELNDVQTGMAASSLFQKYGAGHNVITPGFGMTETCAGAIFNLCFPDYDLDRGHSVATLGKCMNGIEMRVMTGSRPAELNEVGDLEVRGDVVFDGYYRNPQATANAFHSHGGWFHTGDQASINSDGNLCLVGRKNEVININSLKISVASLDLLLEQALGDKVTRYVIFPSRSAHTEQITICYVPRKWSHEAREMAEIEDLAVKACIGAVSSRPFVFCLRECSQSFMPTSTLGKISRAKMSSLFEAGIFKEDVIFHREMIDLYRATVIQDGEQPPPVSPTEALLIEDFAKTLSISPQAIGPETQVFELGFTSMDLIRLKQQIDNRVGTAIPIITLMKNPTARSLATALDAIVSSRRLGSGEVMEYDPVVPFKSTGANTPLWLFHPGVGEALVFVGLAQHLADDDRPVYALRARGFEPGQARFGSIAETVDTYVQSIRFKQPRGPYALAGYSYGAMLAFETAKRLDDLERDLKSTMSSVQFLGSFNLPPHIKLRMRQLSWNMCLLHLTQFLGLTTEADVDCIATEEFSTLHREDALTHILQAADIDRMEELGLDNAALARWADVAYSLQSMAVEYEPSGLVDGMDVFYAIPLKGAAASREEWVNVHLKEWGNFCRTKPKFHAVGGAHYTLLGSEHVATFAAQLKQAMRARGC